MSEDVNIPSSFTMDEVRRSERSLEMLFDITNSVQRISAAYKRTRYRTLWSVFMNSQINQRHNDILERTIHLEKCFRQTKFFLLRKAFIAWKNSRSTHDQVIIPSHPLEHSKSCEWFILHRWFEVWLARYNEQTTEKQIEHAIIERGKDRCTRAKYTSWMSEKTEEIENRRHRKLWLDWTTALLSSSRCRIMTLEQIKLNAGPNLIRLGLKYLARSRLLSCVDAKKRLNREDEWWRLSIALIHADNLKTFQKERKILDIRESFVNMCRHLLRMYRRNRMCIARQKLKNEVAQSVLNKHVKKYFRTWLRKFRVVSETKELMREMFTDSIDTYMAGVAYDAAFTIQESFRRALARRRMDYEQMQRYMVIWRSRMVWTKLQIPEMRCLVDLPLETEVAKLLNLGLNASVFDALSDIQRHNERVSEDLAETLAIESCQKMEVSIPRFSFDVGRKIGAIEEEVARMKEKSRNIEERMMWVEIAGRNLKCDLVKPIDYLSVFPIAKERFLVNRHRNSRPDPPVIGLKNVVRVICDVRKCVCDFGTTVLKTVRKAYFFSSTRPKDETELPCPHLLIPTVPLTETRYLKSWTPQSLLPRQKLLDCCEYEPVLACEMNWVSDSTLGLRNFKAKLLESKQNNRSSDTESLVFEEIVTRIMPSNDAIKKYRPRGRRHRQQSPVWNAIMPAFYYQVNEIDIRNDGLPVVTKSNPICQWMFKKSRLFANMKVNVPQVISRLCSFNIIPQEKHASVDNGIELDLRVLVDIDVKCLSSLEIPYRKPSSPNRDSDWTCDLRPFKVHLNINPVKHYRHLPLHPSKNNLQQLVTRNSPLLSWLFPSSAKVFHDMTSNVPRNVAFLRRFHPDQLKKKNKPTRSSDIDLDVEELVRVDLSHLFCFKRNSYVIPRFSLSRLCTTIGTPFTALVHFTVNPNSCKPLLGYTPRTTKPDLSSTSTEMHSSEGSVTESKQIGFATDTEFDTCPSNEEESEENIDLTALSEHIDQCWTSLRDCLAFDFLGIEMGSIICEDDKVRRHKKPLDWVRRGVRQKTEDVIDASLDNIVRSLWNVDIGASFEVDFVDTSSDDDDTIIDLSAIEEVLDDVVLSVIVPNPIEIGSVRKQRRRKKRSNLVDIVSDVEGNLDDVLNKTLEDLVRSSLSFDVGATTPVQVNDEYVFDPADFLQAHQNVIIDSLVCSSVVDTLSQLQGSIFLEKVDDPCEEEESRDLQEEEEQEYVLPNMLQSLITTDFLDSVLPSACTVIDLGPQACRRKRKHRKHHVPYTMPNYMTTLFTDMTAGSLAEIIMETIEAPFL